MIEVVLRGHVMRTAVPVEHDDLRDVHLAQVEAVLTHPALGGRMAVDERLVAELVVGGAVLQLRFRGNGCLWSRLCVRV